MVLAVSSDVCPIRTMLLTWSTIIWARASRWAETCCRYCSSTLATFWPPHAPRGGGGIGRSGGCQIILVLLVPLPLVVQILLDSTRQRVPGLLHLGRHRAGIGYPLRPRIEQLLETGGVALERALGHAPRLGLL